MFFVSYIKVLLTKEEFFSKVHNRSNSEDSERAARSAVVNLEYYCKDVYNKTAERILADIKTEIEKTGDTRKALKFLDDFVNWLKKDHPNVIMKTRSRKSGKTKKAVRAKTVENYVIFSRKYMKFSFGIKIDDDDFKDFIIIPPDDDDEELEPLAHD